MRVKSTLGSMVLAAWLSAGSALALPKDYFVQPPELRPPGRGSIAGSLASYEPGVDELARGSFTLASVLSAPQSRGPLLATVFPSYSPSTGLTEWGLGWQAPLTITRYRLSGTLTFLDDDFVSPWGRLAQGDDGGWYPAQAPQTAFCQLDPNTGWRVRTPDGTLYEFAQPDALVGLKGTYAWYLSRVTSSLGEQTVLLYDRNSSGRSFLREVQHGRFGSDAGHLIQFGYEVLQKPTVSYASGTAVSLDRRIRQVRMLSRHAGTGQPSLIHHYDLQYGQAEHGPGFFLTGVVKVGAGGSREPAVTYKYNVPDGTPANDPTYAELVPNPVLTQWYKNPANTVQTDWSTPIDVDRDGLLDVEMAMDYRLGRRTPSGFVEEELPPAPPITTHLNVCRVGGGYENLPRIIFFMTPEDPEPTVLGFLADYYNEETTFWGCDRIGNINHVMKVKGYWEMGSHVHVVDLNRDGKPDIIGVGDGGYQIIRNDSDPGTMVWTVLPETLAWYLNVTGSWVHDINGDGIPDLILRQEMSFHVFYGRGNFEFDPTEHVFWIKTDDGGFLADLKKFGIVFEDVNNDGLADLILTEGARADLYMNNGEGQFESKPINALGYITPDTEAPVVADYSGSGNVEITLIHEADQAFSLPLTHAGTSLLREVDDGKGTKITFEYARAKPTKGIRYRPSLVSKIAITRAGEGTKTYSYDYDKPTLHTKGWFLVGFDSVKAVSGGAEELRAYRNDNSVGALLLSREAVDADLADVRPFSREVYSTQTFHGLPWYRKESTVSGLRGGTATASSTAHYDRYEQDFCPTVVRTESRWGTLTETYQLANPSKLTGLPHCLVSLQTVQGRHQDASLDFVQSWSIARNDVGQVTAISELGAPADLTTQQVLYDGQYAVSSVTSAGKGTVRADRDGPTGTLTAVTAADGVRLSIAGRDPVSDAILTMETDRGGTPYRQFFEYDDLGRLAKRWDSVNGGSSQAPLESLAYTYPDAGTDRPGRVMSRLAFDGAKASQTAEVFSGSGASVGSARAIPGGWKVGDIQLTDAQQRLRLTHSSQFIPDAEGRARGASFAALIGQSDVLGLGKQSGLGRSLWVSNVLQGTVEAKTEYAYQVDDGAGLWTTRSDAGVPAERRLQDASGNLAAVVDAYGNATTAVYDALGRVRRIHFANGDEQQADYDAHGRISRVWRTSVGGETYAYDQATRLLKEVAYLDRHGKEERRLAITYDGAGRKTQEAYVSHTGGAARSFTYTYDGAGTSAPGQRGYLTRVKGVGFAKAATYRPDRKLSGRRLEIPGWRGVENTYEYSADGELKADEVTITAPGGAPLARQRFDTQRDATGRLQGLAINGKAAITANYDAAGLLAGFSVRSGAELSMSHDSRTKRLDGVRLDEADGRASDLAWTWGPAGDIVEERLSAGDTPRTRAYNYDARHYMTSWRDDAYGEIYLYNPDARRFHGQFPMDSAGRITRFNRYTLAYDAAGQLQSAVSPAKSVAYVYDEEGQRIAKLVDGQPVAAYLDGDRIDAQDHWRPIMLGRYSVGSALNGKFAAWLADPRGTTVVPAAVDWPGPFGTGVFGSHLYAGQIVEADTGMIRSGVRDLIPSIGEFTTPDSLYIHDPKACIERPTECNLYGYALSNPLAFQDPTGQFVEAAWDAFNVTLGVHSITSWDSQTPLGHKISDVLGLGVDCLAAAIPFIPGGVSAGLKAERSGQSIVEFARSLQGAGDYPGVDRYRRIIVQKGDLVVSGAPGYSHFHTTLKAVERANGELESFWKSLQVKPHKDFGFRPGVTVSRATEDFEAAFGRALTNTDWGRGGFPQLVIREPERVLEPIYSIPLRRTP
jgi:RHS repeat-associated protein